MSKTVRLAKRVQTEARLWHPSTDLSTDPGRKQDLAGATARRIYKKQNAGSARQAHG